VKRLLSFLDFIGSGLLGAVDAFWAGVRVLTRSQPERNARPLDGQFEGLSVAQRSEAAGSLGHLANKNANVPTNA
jgi:hypothetical protein